MRIICEVCKQSAYIQKLGNYYRCRAYGGQDSSTGKSKFFYHQQAKQYAETQMAFNRNRENLKEQSRIDQLNTLYQLELQKSSPKSCGRSLVWLGHQPPTQDLTSFREYLNSRFSSQYARLQYSYVMKYSSLMENPGDINNLPLTIRSNVLKALINLSKFQGQYENFKCKLRNYGIKWLSTDTSFNSFLAIINNNHNNLGPWYSEAMKALAENERLWLKFTLITGLRKAESILAYNLIIKLNAVGKLNSYYNEELGILEHFKQNDSNDKPLFLRGSKNAYLSCVNKEMVQKIANSQPIYYITIRKHIEKHRLPLRVKECRSYNNTFLRTHQILSEYVDLLAGRIPRNVFCRHYLKIEDLKKLVTQVLAVTMTMESSLLS